MNRNVYNIFYFISLIEFLYTPPPFIKQTISAVLFVDMKNIYERQQRIIYYPFNMKKKKNMRFN